MQYNTELESLQLTNPQRHLFQKQDEYHVSFYHYIVWISQMTQKFVQRGMKGGNITSQH